MKAIRFLWGAFPASPLAHHGNDRKYWAGPIPKGTVIPEDCLFTDAEKENVVAWIDKAIEAAKAPKAKKGRDTRTKDMFKGAA